ncbi:hypothetical protein C8R45DRAFT_1149060 [Mycena sanguinolenta]|nr:hypothetical protein C8R45DRAFT_1149060 [Mycena sanguinolenta]
MASEADAATGFNNEARKLFEGGKFEEAGKLYERANKADTMNSPIYLSNLALVHLKLKQFEKAEICATMALCRDPRFVKARYRRAMARWRRGRPMESLIDLATVLTLDPMDKGAVAAFASVSNEYESSGGIRRSLEPMQILQADYPSPYGSAAVPRPRTAQNVSRANGVVIPDLSSRIPKDLRAGTWKTCGTPNAAGVAILVTPFLEPGNENNKSRTALFMERLIPELAILIKNSICPVGVQSHSFGTGRKLTADLDELYWSLEDELANDVDNYYGLQR